MNLNINHNTKMTPKYKRTPNFRSNDPGPAARELFETSQHRLEGGERRPIMFHFSAGQPAFCCLFGFLLICYHSSPNTRYKAANETIVCQHPDGPHEAERCKQKTLNDKAPLLYLMQNLCSWDMFCLHCTSPQKKLMTFLFHA